MLNGEKFVVRFLHRPMLVHNGNKVPDGRSD
jgi:hypothetical protein